MYCTDQQLRERAFDRGAGINPLSESNFESMRAMDERHAATPVVDESLSGHRARMAA